jgi:UDP:flavonoid glycosyltransferase YjiC (YdhE family)
VSSTCLFLINGLGLGNSTRCHAIIERLAEADCRVHVMTSGNGLAYFQDKTCVASLSPMESFYYSGTSGGISGWSTLKSLRTLLRIARTKRAQLDRLLDQIQPDAVVIDSEYALSPARRRGIPIAALNTSEIVVTEYLRKRRSQPGIRSHFWLVEFSDYLFHRHYCDLVLSPFPLRTPPRHPKFRRIGLIVRSQVKQRFEALGQVPAVTPRQAQKVVFMLSGSVHASRIPFEKYKLPFRVEVVGQTGNSTGAVTFHGRKMDNTDLLLGADVLVINGGYSAVSEAFLLRKPVFVVPVPGHAEQFVNACLVHDLGLGFIATESNVLDQLLKMHAADTWLDRVPMPPTFELDGAGEAAGAILALLLGQKSVQRDHAEFKSQAESGAGA